ncbi:MAG: CD3324 family protein [Eubacteriales bacterium]|nr:CD3324 family protein [Clostridia bacterium]MDY2845589.1 CD3324 family protein [Eubacteriales bacterium]
MNSRNSSKDFTPVNLIGLFPRTITSWLRKAVTIIRYLRADEVLPTELLEEIKRYIDEGCAIYIPKSQEKCVWGGKSGSRELLDRRNDEIRLAYSNGEDILSLSERYCLCEDSIRKILKKNRAG